MDDWALNGVCLLIAGCVWAFLGQCLMCAANWGWTRGRVPLHDNVCWQPLQYPGWDKLATTQNTWPSILDVFDKPKSKAQFTSKVFGGHTKHWPICQLTLLSPHSNLKSQVTAIQRQPKIDIDTVNIDFKSIYSPDNASRLCGWDGVWAERTDYSACKLMEQDTRVMEEVEMGADLEISIIIYLIGEMSTTDHCSIVSCQLPWLSNWIV